VNDSPSPQEIVARARDLAPRLRERSAQADGLRRVPDETVADLVAAGLTRIVQPARHGGFGMGWDVLCESSMALARGCGSQGWVANIFAEHNFLIGLFPDQAQRDVWGGNPDAVASSSFIPRGNSVEAVEDGYVLSGRWPFQSGVHHTGWSVVGELAPGAGGTREHHYFLVPARDRTIIDDWHTIGMMGTGSCSVELRKAFVPAHRTLPNALVAAGAAPGAELNTALVFRMPMIGFSQLALASVVVGIASAMTDEFTDFARDRVQQGRMRPGSEALPARLAEAAAEARAARLLVLDAARANMQKLSGRTPRRRVRGHPGAARRGPAVRGHRRAWRLCRRTFAARLPRHPGRRRPCRAELGRRRAGLREKPARAGRYETVLAPVCSAPARRWSAGGATAYSANAESHRAGAVRSENAPAAPCGSGGRA